VRRKVGLKWHVSDSSNVPLPFPNRGVSFLAFDADGLIKVRSMGLARPPASFLIFVPPKKECNDFVEPTVKIGPIQLPLLRRVSKILRIQ